MVAADSSLSRQPQSSENGKHMNRNQYRLWRQEDGATSIEYALIAALITGVIALTVFALGGQVRTLFTTATAMFP
jgi:pilus assembly protein Flp/PilA